MPVTPSSYRFDLTNTLLDIARMNEWLTGVLKDLAVSDSVSYSILLAVEEAVTNVVSYAFPPDTQHVIGVALEADPSHIVVTISDDGMAFDPLAQPPPTPPTDLATAKIGGLGIVLIRQYASSVRYERRDGTNRLELTFAVG